MTTLYLPEIADDISRLNITGVTVRDKDQVAASWSEQPNVLYPNPDEDGWIANFIVNYNIAGEVDTITYNLNYKFLSTKVGDISTFPRAYSDLIDKLSKILAVLLDTTAPYSDNVEMKVTAVTVGGRQDLAGNEYHGADITLSIEEQH